MIEMMMYGTVLYATVTAVLWQVVLGVYHTGGVVVLPKYRHGFSLDYRCSQTCFQPAGTQPLTRMFCLAGCLRSTSS